jgi:acyl carrier protein
MNVEQEIRTFIVDNFLFGDDAGLREESSFLREGIVDSTGIMQLVSFIQESYGIAVEDEELIPENLDSIKRVASFIRSKRGSSHTDAAASDAAGEPYAGG